MFARLPLQLRDQLEIAHSHLNMVDLTDRGDLHAFNERVRAEARLASMGPGSGIAVGEPGGQMIGDPAIVARSREAEAYKARLAAQAQARLDAEAIKFAGPYRVFNSVA